MFVGLCREQPLAVVEMAGRLDLPVSVVKVLIGDLVEQAPVVTRAPVAVDAPEARLVQPEARLVQKVIEGVRRL